MPVARSTTIFLRVFNIRANGRNAQNSPSKCQFTVNASIANASGSFFQAKNFLHFALLRVANKSISGCLNISTARRNAWSASSHSVSIFFIRDSRSASTLSSDLIYEAIIQIFLASHHCQIFFAILCRFGCCMPPILFT